MKHVFKREEEKFVLPISVAEDIRDIALKELDFSEFNRGGSLTDIRTTYLENDDFLIYHLKKCHMNKRYKVRIREYGKNGVFEPLVWIELKEKVDGSGYKNRFRMERDCINDFLGGYNVFESVKNSNRNIDGDYLSILYNNIQNLVTENNFYPRLVMQYQRLAIQSDDYQGLRLTFDYNLKGGIINRENKIFTHIDNPQYFDKYKSVVELKIGNIYPKEVDIVKEKFSIEKQKFSKFTFGMESLYDDFNQIPENITANYVPMSKMVNYGSEYAV